MILTLNDKLSPVARVFEAIDKGYPVGSELRIISNGHPADDELKKLTGEVLEPPVFPVNMEMATQSLPSEEALAAEVMRERRLIENLREGE